MALVGGGFAGLCTGAHLRMAGISDVRIIDGAGDVGGVWYWNRYPGAMCDTAAMVYLPLLEETGHMPSMKYVYGAEIFEHARRIAETFDLYDDTLFSTEVTSLTWDGDTSRWVIETDRGDRFRAKYVAMGTRAHDQAQAAGHPGHRDLRAVTPSTPPAGTTRTRAATTPAPAWRGSPDKRVGDHRDRCHRRAVHPAVGSRRRRAVRVPADAVVDRRAQQPPDRPRQVRRSRGGLAAEVAA